MKCELCAAEIPQDDSQCPACAASQNYEQIYKLLSQALNFLSEKIHQEIDKPKLLFLIGNLYRLRGEIDRAISYYETAVKEGGAQPDYYRTLGTALSIKSDFKAAVEMMRKSVDLCPHYPDYRNDLGAAYFKDGQYDKAIEEFKEAIRLNPNYANAHNNLALAYRKKSAYEQAEREISEAIRLDPKHAVANYELGRSYYHGGMFSQSRSVQHATLPTAKELADLYMIIQNYELAVKYYRIYLSLHPNYTDIWVAVARAYTALKNTKEAEEALREALRINPEYQEAKTLLNQILNEGPS